MNWLSYFLVAFFISLLGTALLVGLARKKTDKKFKRLGGAAIIVAFVLSVIFNPELFQTSQIWGLILGAILILIFGVWDDFKNFSWKPQLMFQLLLVLILVVSGFSVFYFSSFGGEMIRTDFGSFEVAGQAFSFLSIFLVALWVLATINAVGWSDGIDALAGGIALLGGVALFLVSLRPEVNQPAVAILAIIFLGAVLGFWIFNLPFAKIEAGTSGSYFIGFFLASMAVIAGTKIATAMIVLAIPLVDFVWVVWERKKAGVPITGHEKFSRHLHYKLKNIGWSDGKIVTSYVSFIVLMMLVSQAMGTRSQKIVLLILEFLLITIFIHFVSQKNKKTWKKNQKI